MNPPTEFQQSGTRELKKRRQLVETFDYTITARYDIISVSESLLTRQSTHISQWSTKERVITLKNVFLRTEQHMHNRFPRQLSSTPTNVLTRNSLFYSHIMLIGDSGPRILEQVVRVNEPEPNVPRVCYSAFGGKV